MKCDKVRKLISQYLDGELSAETNKEIKNHLKHCPECNALANTLEATVSLSHDIEKWEILPREIFSNLHNMLKEEWHLLANAPKIKISSSSEPNAIPANIFEQGDCLILIIELPGTEKKNLQLIVGPNSLEVSGIKGNQSKGKYYINEINYGDFFRRIELPYQILPEKTKSSFKNGLLRIKMFRKQLGIRSSKA